MDTIRVARVFPVTLILGFVCTSAQAEWRCDCSTIVDSCNASVAVENNWVSVETDHGQCARVDYLIDGQPFVSLVVEGRDRQSWLSRSDDPRIVMQSCVVCLDKADTANAIAAVDAASATADARAASTFAAARADVADASTVEGQAPAQLDEPAIAREPERLLAVKPQYPPSAAARGVDGFVDVRFTVTPLGRVEAASVTAAEPPGVFDAAALRAISRWRYNTDESRAPATLTHHFDFDVADAVVAGAGRAHASSAVAVDALIARAAARRESEDGEPAPREPEFVDRNGCIRENVSYDYGEMVEVDLMNACNEPLIVYSCAAGMGRYQSRWVCSSMEKAQSILVRPGDPLAGSAAMIEIPEGQRTFRYAEDLYVARAPNTEYWWLACDVENANCRSSGRGWVRSMDLKAANVDPQLWTEERIARSY